MVTQGFAGAEVVVGVDGSSSSVHAAIWAAAEARRRGRGLALVWAIEPPVVAGSVGMGLPPAPDYLQQWEYRALEQLRAIAHDIASPQARTVVTVGAPSAVLLEMSARAELIVVGSRGRGGFAGLLLGSVGAQLAPHAQCPVVIVRDSAREGAHAIVVGVDGSSAGQGALDFACDEASRHGWDVIVVHAWEVPAYDLIAVPQLPAPVPLSDTADDELRLTAEALTGYRERYPDLTIEERLVRGPAATALLDASTDAALIVVGSHGHGPLVGALLGSVSHSVLHRAQVPVVVVPEHAIAESAA